MKNSEGKTMAKKEISEIVRLNLGCGFRKKEGFINIDSNPDTNPDLLHDVAQGLPYDNDSVDSIIAFDFLEHLERMEVVGLMKEIYRVLKSGGQFTHVTPSSEGRGAFQDPHHKSFWNLNTWRYYFVEPDYLKLYGLDFQFKIIHLEDVWTDKANLVLHTHCIYEAVK